MEQGGARDKQQFCAILYADVKTASKITADAQKLAITDIIDSFRHKAANSPTHIFDTFAGDGCLILSATCADLAERALNLRDTFRQTDWKKKGFADSVEVRIALDFGRVVLTMLADGKLNGTSHELDRASRLEPITDPNHVYCTELFFKALLSETPTNLDGDCLGELELAKGAGTAIVYNLRWKWETSTGSNGKRHNGSSASILHAVQVLELVSMDTENAITKVVQNSVDQTIRLLKDSAKNVADVAANTLYTEIIERIKSAGRVRLLDQDIWRWAELIQPDLTISTNVINYSNDILFAMVSRARELGTSLDLHRIFAINPGWLKDANQWTTVAEILNDIQAACKKGEGRIRNSILFPIPWNKKGSKFVDRVEFTDVETSALRLRDVAIFDSDVIYQEDITYEKRSDASQSTAKIIIDPDRIREMLAMFESLEPFVYSIPEFLQLSPFGGVDGI